MKAFTLIELMVVVAIVAILLILCLPSYQNYVHTTKRVLARTAVLEVMVRQEQFFLDNKHYADTLLDLGFAASPYAIDAHGEPVSVSSAHRVYLIDLRASGGEYALSAIPQLSQVADRCGTLSIGSSGIKSVEGAGTAAECW